MSEYNSNTFGSLNNILGGIAYTSQYLNVINDSNKYNIGIVRSYKPFYSLLYNPDVRGRQDSSSAGGTIFDVTKFGNGGRFIRTYYPTISTAHQETKVDLNHSNYIHYSGSSEGGSSLLPVTGSTTTSLNDDPTLATKKVPWTRNKRDVDPYSPYSY